MQNSLFDLNIPTHLLNYSLNLLFIQFINNLLNVKTSMFNKQSWYAFKKYFIAVFYS